MKIESISIGKNVSYQDKDAAVIERVRAKTKPHSIIVNNTKHTMSEVTFVVRVFEDEKTYWASADELKAITPKKIAPVKVTVPAKSESRAAASTQKCIMNNREYQILARVRVKEKIHGALENVPGLETKSMPIATYVIQDKTGMKRVACTDVQLIESQSVKGGNETKTEGKARPQPQRLKQDTKTKLEPFVMPNVNVIGPGYAREGIGRIEDVKPVIKPLPDAFRGDFSALLRYKQNNHSDC